MTLVYYKLHETAKEPSYSTRLSACFDICVSLEKGYVVRNKGESNFSEFSDTEKLIELVPSKVYLLKTGLIFKLDFNHSMRIHPRSGLALRHGLKLVNCEGIIDSDYTDELKLIVEVDCPLMIAHGDRICQGELVKTEFCNIIQTFKKPSPEDFKIPSELIQDKSNIRSGGFGSTGN